MKACSGPLKTYLKGLSKGPGSQEGAREPGRGQGAREPGSQGARKGPGSQGGAREPGRSLKPPRAWALEALRAFQGKVLIKPLKGFRRPLRALSCP